MCEVAHFCKIHCKRQTLSNKKKVHIRRHLPEQSLPLGICTNTLFTPANSKYESKKEDIHGRVWEGKVRKLLYLRTVRRENPPQCAARRPRGMNPWRAEHHSSEAPQLLRLLPGHSLTGRRRDKRRKAE